MSPRARSWAVVAVAPIGGGMTALAFAPTRVVVLAIVGPAAGLWAFSRAATVLRAASAGLLYGLVFTFLTFRWMLELDLIAYVVLCGLQSGFWAVTATLTRWMARLRPGWWVVGVTATWTLVELARARWPVSGFEWGQLGLAAADTVVRRAVAVVGTLGLTGLMVALAAGITVVIVHRSRRSAVPLAVAVAALAGVTALGSVSWTTPGETLEVALVQTDVPCAGEFAQDCPDYSDVLLDMYVARTATLETVPDLILWGEDALYGGETLDAVGRQFVERYGPLPAPLLAGTATPGEPGHFFRWAALFDTDGTSLGGYAKRRPVPFGEYVPLRSLLGGISDVGRLVPSDMVPGRSTSPLAVPVDGGTVDIAAAVSWEVSFSRLVRDVAQHADGMATLTTVSSYGTSAASDQLLAAAQLRAAEHQKPMAVAATTGRSAMIVATGDLVARTALLQRDDMTAAMPLRSGLTPFARAGDVPVGMAALAVLLVIVLRLRRDRTVGDATAAGTDEEGRPAMMDERADSALR